MSEMTSGLEGMLGSNPTVDWRSFDLGNEGLVGGLDFHGLERAAALPLLEAYQRVLRLLPPGEEARVIPLLEAGLHSAIQIAGIPRDEFLRRFCALFPGDEALALRVHGVAQGRRSELLLHYINDVQHNEPHYRAARFK